MNTVYYWMDGTWCYKCEYNPIEYCWKSYDFGTLSITDDNTEEEIQIMVDELVG